MSCGGAAALRAPARPRACPCKCAGRRSEQTQVLSADPQRVLNSMVPELGALTVAYPGPLPDVRESGDSGQAGPI